MFVLALIQIVIIALASKAEIYKTEIGKVSGDIYFYCPIYYNSVWYTNVFRRAYNETQVSECKIFYIKIFK